MLNNGLTVFLIIFAGHQGIIAVEITYLPQVLLTSPSTLKALYLVFIASTHLSCFTVKPPENAHQYKIILMAYSLSLVAVDSFRRTTSTFLSSRSLKLSGRLSSLSGMSSACSVFSMSSNDALTNANPKSSISCEFCDDVKNV